MREEYRAIVDAGFILQIDDPDLADRLADATANELGRLSQVSRAAHRRADTA